MGQGQDIQPPTPTAQSAMHGKGRFFIVNFSTFFCFYNKDLQFCQEVYL